MQRISRRLVLLVAVLPALVGATGYAVWNYGLSPKWSAQLAGLLGREVSVGSWRPGFGFFVDAKDVRIMGRPPFHKEAAATIESIRIRLGGAAGLFSPSDVQVTGLDVSVLGTPDTNNLGPSTSPTPDMRQKKPQPTGPRIRPTIHVYSGSVSGVLALKKGVRVAFRVRGIQAERDPQGEWTAALSTITVDIQDGVSLKVPQLAFSKSETKGIAVDGADVSIQVPRQGNLVQGLSLHCTGKDGAWEFSFSNAPPTFPANKAGMLLGEARIRDGKATFLASVDELPLAPLEGLLRKHSLGLTRATGTLSASARFDLASLQGTFDVSTAVKDFTLQHPAWDKAPWEGMNAKLVAHGNYDHPSRTLHVDQGTLDLLGMNLVLDGGISFSGPPKGRFTLATPDNRPASCAAVWNAQPAPIRDTLAGLAVDGKWAFQVGIEFNASAWDATQLSLRMPSLCTVRSEPRVLARLYPILVNPKLADPIETKRALGTFHPDFVQLSSLPAYIPNAFITSEDSRFFRHNGFDLDMMRVALAQNLASHSFGRGASTITQQLAKNLFLSHQRTLVRKIEEAILAWRLHRLLGKDRILELYLNIIELGPGIQGIKQASHLYFGKEPTELTPLEASHLAALTPNPHILARRFRDGEVDEGWTQRLIDLLTMMKRTGRLTPEQLKEARGSSLVLRPLSGHARK